MEKKEKSIAQQIAEIMCRRNADKKKEILPQNFWNIHPYKKQYQLQIIRVNIFLKAYRAEAVLNAILKNKNIYSLFCPWLDELIQKEEILLQNTSVKIVEDIKPAQIPGSSFQPKTSIDDL